MRTKDNAAFPCPICGKKPHIKTYGVNTAHAYCTGYAMSAAFEIFLAGHKRYCYKHSTFMYHQMYCHRDGKYQDLVEDRVEMDRLNKNSEEYVLERTKFTRQDIDNIRIKKIDFYFQADDAIKYGVVDEVI